MIIPGIVGDNHQLPREKGGQPFSVGRVSASKAFVHILDDASLDLLLNNLDTVWDFAGYLRKKEAFITSGRLAMAAGEEALLGWYVGKINEQDEHDFVVPVQAGDKPLALDESHWHTGSVLCRRCNAA